MSGQSTARGKRIVRAKECISEKNKSGSALSRIALIFSLTDKQGFQFSL